MTEILSNTAMRRLAHRMAAGLIEGALGAGWETETFLPGEPLVDSTENRRLLNAIQAIADKLFRIGDRDA